MLFSIYHSLAVCALPLFDCKYNQKAEKLQKKNACKACEGEKLIILTF
jgi:hypothetical protein